MDAEHVTAGMLAKNGRIPSDLGRTSVPETANGIVIDWDEAVQLDFGQDSTVLLGDRIHFDRA